MIQYRRSNLAKRSFHKFVLRDNVIDRPWENVGPLKDKVASAKRFCDDHFNDDRWTCFQGRDYGLFLIEDNEDATLFHLKFLTADKEYKGVKYFS